MEIFVFLVVAWLCCVLIGANSCVPEMDTYTPAPVKPAGKSKWAIVALTKNVDVLVRRNKQMADLIRPFAAKHDVTMIVFSEEDFPTTRSGMVQGWKDAFNGVAKVKFVNTKTDGFYEQNSNGNWYYRYGYKYMCKFFMLDMYKYLSEYDYYWRVDSDDFMTELKYDIFEWVEKNNVEYGYAARKIEGHGATRRTLPPWTASYIAKCNLWPQALMDEPLNKCFNFYNNFHIGKVGFFAQPDVLHFLRAVNASGNVDKHRWGDSTIQAYAVRVFMDPANIRMLPDLSYQHKSHGMVKISTFNKSVPATLPHALGYWVHESHKDHDWL
jgi:hypothetical protein